MIFSITLNISTLFVIFMVLSSCSKQSGLHFMGPDETENRRRETLEIEVRNHARFEAEKKQTLIDITKDGRESFEKIKPILKQKCFACHDSKTSIPVYGRILRNHNPIYHHQMNGIKALDFSGKFPLVAQGNPPQIALLKSLKAAVLDRSMPLKGYRTIYPRRKINEEDEKAILSWVEPLIERLEDYELRFTSPSLDVSIQAKKIFEMKCFRCHANGNNRGNFGGMEKMSDLLNSRYVIHQNADESPIFRIMLNGKMPPNPRDTLTLEELMIIREWIEKRPLDHGE